jgi:hypothetical protein
MEAGQFFQALRSALAEGFEIACRMADLWAKPALSDSRTAATLPPLEGAVSVPFWEADCFPYRFHGSRNRLPYNFSHDHFFDSSRK